MTNLKGNSDIIFEETNTKTIQNLIGSDEEPHKWKAEGNTSEGEAISIDIELDLDYWIGSSIDRYT